MLGSLSAAAQTEPPQDSAARRLPPLVREIEIRSDGPVDRPEVERLIALQVGEPFDEARIRKTLRSLRFSEVAAEVAVYERPAVAGGDAGDPRPSGDGVVAIVALWTPMRVSAVEIAGETGLKTERLRDVLPFDAGQPLVEDRVLRGLYALKDIYVEEGYLAAAVTLDVQVDELARDARVVYQVSSGPRSRIREVRFEGAEGILTEEELRRSLRAGPGDNFRVRWVEENGERLERLLIGRDFRMPHVERLPDRRDDAAAMVDLAYRIEPGPKLELRILGAERRELEKKGLLPFLGEGGYDDALVLQSIERIRRYYQERGHYRVEVQRHEERNAQHLRLTLEIRPAPRFSLEELGFEGNVTFTSDRLRALVSTSPRRFLQPKSGRLVDQELSADVANLRSFYALEGFDQARVGPPRVDQRGTELAVAIPIEEGRRRSVASLVLEGLAPLDERAVRETLPLRVGGPYHRLRVEQGVELLRYRLEQLGYGGAIVDSEISWSADELTAAVALKSIPGRREVVASVVVRGLEQTDPEVVRRFLGLEAGDPVSGTALLDVQRRLYGLGVFTRVEVRIPPAGEVGDAREILVEVAEGKSRAVSLGLGYDSESGARGLARLTHGNLFGRISSLTLDLLLSQREQHSRLIYRQPYLLRWNAELQGTLYNEHEERPDFTVDRTGLQVAIQRPIDRWSLQLLSSYRIVELDAGEFNDEIPLESRNARVASITPGASYDRRNDALDPTRGWMASAQLEYALPLADANANFFKLFVQASGYLPFGTRTVLAGSLRAGAIEPLASATAGVDDILDASTPAAELFYAGGRTSHRAYERDGLGIVGETLIIDDPGSPGNPFPAGGGGLLLANLELRFPIFGPVGGTVFADGGNVWRDYRDVDPQEIKWGAGVGVRYLSPVGPLRLEIGWKLDREPFEDPYVWFFSLGNAF